MVSNEKLLLWWSSGMFVIFAVMISIFAILAHLRHYTVPQHQRYIVRILIMVPIYAIDAWFSLRFIDVRVFVELIRHCYEAYVLYCFFLLLVNYLEGENNIITIFGL
jgi:bacteriorhodopsin